MAESGIQADAGFWQGVCGDSGSLTKKRGRKGTRWKCPEALQGGLECPIPWASLGSSLTRKDNPKGRPAIRTPLSQGV